MRKGYRIIDIDTHVNPCVEVLLDHADKDMRDRMDDLKPYLRVVTPRLGQGDAEDREEFSIISIAPVRYQRVAGAKPPTDVDTSGTHNLAGRTQMANRSPIAVGAAEDNAPGRLQDMDVEGRDIDFIIPGPWAYGAPAMDLGLEKGLYRSYHQYMADYCSADSRRLKSMVLVPGRDPEWSAQVIRDHIKEDWAAAVWPLLPTDMPIDDPDLEPIWKASNEGNFPIMYHGFHIEPPYFPGYRDIWDNPAMGRCAGQTWGGQRFLSFMLMGGMLDRYPNLRVGTMECGHGWLPQWLLRLTRQIDYVRGSVSADLKYSPMEYTEQGRVFCSVDLFEGVAMTKAVGDILGDHVLMYESDYPHPETIYPDHTDMALDWENTLGKKVLDKMMWENAARYLRLTTKPW